MSCEIDELDLSVRVYNVLLYTMLRTAYTTRSILQTIPILPVNTL